MSKRRKTLINGSEESKSDFPRSHGNCNLRTKVDRLDTCVIRASSLWTSPLFCEFRV